MTHQQARTRDPIQRLSALAAALLLLALPARADTPSLASILRLVRGERWTQAIEGLEALTAAEPDNALAWFYLAYVHHNAGDLRRALEVGPKAAAFPEVRATALYNMACAHSVLNEVEQASASLAAALAAGYLDFDSLVLDPELETLRSATTLVLPKSHEYVELRGRNGVVIPHRVLLPADFDPEREYSVAVSFAPGSGGPLATDWSIEHFWGERPARPDWIVVCAVAPRDGWLNHPSHHALEDLFEQLRSDYKVAGKRFHLVGFAEGGRPAANYAGMSRRYTASLTVASASCFNSWDEGDFGSLRGVPVRQIVGSEAPYLLALAKSAQARLESRSASAYLQIVAGQGVLLEGFDSAQLLEAAGRGLPEEPD